jgi:hypothetical protein
MTATATTTTTTTTSLTTTRQGIKKCFAMKISKMQIKLVRFKVQKAKTYDNEIFGVNFSILEFHSLIYVNNKLKIKLAMHIYN